MSQEITHKLPIFVKGTVIKGFGRGSKDLGIPTGKISGYFKLDFISYRESFTVRVSRSHQVNI